jgi:hypothetical protein
MRFKLDENLDPRLAASLTAAGHDVSTVPAQRLSGRSDEAIYAVCLAEARILVTLDLDFSNPLRFPVADTPGIIVLRPPGPFLRLIARLVEELPALLRREQPAGRLWILQPGRLRVFTPDEP